MPFCLIVLLVSLDELVAGDVALFIQIKQLPLPLRKYVNRFSQTLDFTLELGVVLRLLMGSDFVEDVFCAEQVQHIRFDLLFQMGASVAVPLAASGLLVLAADVVAAAPAAV